ncbi:ATP-grasp domain-containing protein [Streptomyces sp. NPDC089915]|uniref:ATP-grasp domain-containing protein n=1 Tax=Streptomyces sp. NPDC089915 TaxID=3155186 RepID=UPI00342BD02B
MRKVLLVEAMGAAESLLDAGRDLGVEIVVATHPEIYECYAPAVKDKITSVVFTDFSDPAAARRELADYARAEGVAAVVGCWEFLTPLAARLAADLGLPGNDPERADGCRNKRVMAALFAEHGVPAPRTLLAEDHETAAALLAASGLTYPVVVKPAEQAGSWGVSVIRGPAELPAAFAAARAWPYESPHGFPLDTTVLVQEYVEGVEYSVESVVFEGRITPLTVVQKFTTDGVFRAETGQTVPAALDDTDTATLYETTALAVRALGITDGVAHTELKLLPGGGAKIIEVGARLPGDRVPELIRLARGVDEARAWIEVALGIEPDLTPRADRAAAIRFFVPPRAGRFRSIDGVVRSPQVHRIAVYPQPDEEVRGPGDNDGRVGYVMLTAATPQKVNRAADAAVANLTIELE